MLQQELPSESDLAYADFLSLDISMLRLFESFLEATPQLTLVLAIVLQSGHAEYYQCECWASDCPLGSLQCQQCPRKTEHEVVDLDSKLKPFSSFMQLEK